VLAEKLDVLLFILGILEPPGAAIIALGLLCKRFKFSRDRSRQFGKILHNTLLIGISH
jgi:hypothetical protein